MDYDDEDGCLCLSFWLLRAILSRKMYPDIYGISKITTTSTQTKNGSMPPMEHNLLTREQKPVCNSPFVTRFSAFLWANCQRDIFVGEQWCRSLFNIHHCGYAILTNCLISSQVHPVTEPVAATGSEISGGSTSSRYFSLLFRCSTSSLMLGTYTSTTFWSIQLLLIGGTCELWPLPIRQPIRASGTSYENRMNMLHAEMDVLIMSTINWSPGFSRVVRVSSIVAWFIFSLPFWSFFLVDKAYGVALVYLFSEAGSEIQG